MAEVPADDARACAFFESCGWVVEARMRDYSLDLSAVPARLAPKLVQSITTSELIAAGALALDAPRPWARSVPLLAKRDDVRGLAIASPDRIEAWILWRDVDGVRELQGLGSSPGGSQTLVPTLLGHLAALSGEAVVLSRWLAHEWPDAPLEAFGFRPGPERIAYRGTATPA